MAQYLGKPISALLGDLPFSGWPVDRSVEEDLDEPRTYYVFGNGALELFCDSDERIKAIFLCAEECDGVRLSEIPFHFTRKQVLEQLGPASESGTGVRDRVLGDSGAWDRFRRPGHSLHVEYRTDSDAIRQVTLMRGDAIP